MKNQNSYRIGKTYISATTPADAQSRIEQAALSGQGGYVCVSNMRMVRYAGKNNGYANLMKIVSKGFVENVRGVDSSSVVNNLVEKGLVEEAGRLDVPGKPIVYKTTSIFLRSFGLSSIADLPPLPGHENVVIEEEPESAGGEAVGLTD